MDYLLGYGLPESLTPERVEKVLGFASSMERAFGRALEAENSPVWVRAEPAGDFYPRLHDLLRTAEGRRAYRSARRAFEKTKNKWKKDGRASFSKRLARLCIEELRQSQPHASLDNMEDVTRDVIPRMVEAKNWSGLAEFLWAYSIYSGNANSLVKTAEAYKELTPVLIDVLKGVVPTGEEESATKEADPEAEREKKIIAQIASLSDTLSELESKNLSDKIDASVNRLAEIVRTRRDELKRMLSTVDKWRSSHQEPLSDELRDMLTRIEKEVEHGHMNESALDTCLSLTDMVVAIDNRIQKLDEDCRLALDRRDYDSARLLTNELESQESQRKEIYESFDETFRDLVETAPEKEAPPPREKETDRDVDRTPPERDADGAHDTDQSAPDDARGAPARAAPAAPASERAAPPGPAPDEREPGEPEPDGDSRAAPPPDEPDPAALIGSAVARALEGGRFGLAYRLAIAAPDSGSGPSAVLLADAVLLAACNHAADGKDVVASELLNAAESLRKELEAWAEARPEAPLPADYAALAAAAALGPGLIAPGGPVAQLLGALDAHLNPLPALRALAHTAAGVSKTGAEIPLELLRTDDSIALWNEKEAALREETQDWSRHQREGKLNFQAATGAWHRILEDWGDEDRRASIGRMLHSLLRPAENAGVERALEIAEHWRRHGDAEIDRIDRNLRDRAATNRIEGKARRDLRDRIAQAVAFADRWGALLDEKPGGKLPFDREQAKLLRAAAAANGEPALAEVAALATPMARRAHRLIRGYLARFADAADDAPEPPAAPMVLLSELLAGDPPESPEAAIDLARRRGLVDDPAPAPAAVENGGG